MTAWQTADTLLRSLGLPVQPHVGSTDRQLHVRYCYYPCAADVVDCKP